MKKPKILLISSQFPNPKQPERGIFTYQIASNLNKECSVRIVSPLPWIPPLPCLQKKWIAYSGIPSIAPFKEFQVFYPKYFMIPLIGDYFSYLSLYYSMSQLFKGKLFHEKPDLINVHWAYPDAVAVEKFFSKYKIPIIVSLLGSDVNRDMNRPYFCKIIKKTLDRCAHVVTVSDSLKTAVVGHGISKDKISTVNNGVDFVKFQIQDKMHCRLVLGLKTDQYYIVFIGRLEPVKGLETLLEAVKENRERLSHVKIILIGDGSLSKKLKEECAKNNLNEFFIFVGHQSHDSISKWYGAADLFCLPSFNEGHPNVIMEAIASGRPVVASDVGAVSKFVTNQVGVLFQAGNPKSLSDALQCAISKSWNSEIIRSSIAAKTWQENARKYIDIFHKILTSEK